MTSDQPAPVALDEPLVALLRSGATCYLATTMPDGSPQLTQTWVDTDGENVVINVVDGMQKARNVARDPRVAVNVVDPDDVFRFFQVRGRVVRATQEGGEEGIDALSMKYLGRPYPRFDGGGARLVLTIAADSVSSPRG